MQRKVSVIGGGGLRTPLLVHGLLRAQALLNVGELQLYDVDQSRAELMASLGREIAKNLKVQLKIAAVDSIDAHGRNVALLREYDSKTTVIWLYEDQEGENETAEEPPPPGPAF